MKFKGNEEGFCPFCGEQALEYDEVQFSGEYCYFPWECVNCGHKGREYYSMEFAGHNVFDEKDNEIEIKWNMIEEED